MSAPHGLFQRCAFEGAFQSLIERRSGLFVLLLRDPALFMLHFELKQFVLQRFEEHTGTV